MNKTLIVPIILTMSTLFFSHTIVVAQPVVGAQVRFATVGVSTGVKNPVAVLRNQGVQEELKLDEKQKSQFQEMQNSLNKWRIDSYSAARKLKGEERSTIYQEINKQYQKKYAELGKEMKKLLNEKQLARYDQIVLHMEGANALARTDIADKLKMAEEQRQQVVQIGKENDEQRMKLMEEMRSRTIDSREYREKIAELTAQKEVDLYDILTLEQLDELKKLRGAKFEFARRQGGAVAIPAPVPIRRR